MHMQTGALATFESEEDALLAGYTPLSTFEQVEDKNGNLFKRLFGMNRHERRAYMAQQRRAK